MVRSLRIPAVLVIAAALAACGGDDDSGAGDTAAPAPAASAAPSEPDATPASTTAPATPPAETVEQAGDAAVVGVGTTELGEILVDSSGLSLYAFLTDTGRQSSCYEACAQAWPPLLVERAEVPDGLDPAVFSVTERTDGTHQLVAGDWPLYTYFEDGAPGDVFGQGSGGVWYVVDPTGEVIGAEPAGWRYDY